MACLIGISSFLSGACVHQEWLLLMTGGHHTVFNSCLLCIRAANLLHDSINKDCFLILAGAYSQYHWNTRGNLEEGV